MTSTSKYPGRLGKRRLPTSEQKLLAAMAARMAARGMPRPAIEQELAAAVDAIANVNYYDEGITLVVKHLGVRTEFHGIQATGGYFWQELAMKLLQRHVPYFMPPAQRGAPPTLQSLFPLLEMFIQGIRQGDAMSVIDAGLARLAEQMGAPPPLKMPLPPVKWTIERAYVEISNLARCAPETVEREFVKWRGKRPRGNFSK